MTYKIVMLCLMLGFSVFLAGFAVGRRVGIKEGRSEGEAIVPIKLKQKMMESCFCPLCLRELSQELNEGKIYDKI